jgi:demethylmenaquinone methyltransferase/2-methoxy-6-polyprenyl-1,4-benzoquinol methylase
MVEVERQQPMIEAPVATDAIRRAYDVLSPVYGWCVAPLERKPRLRGLELGEIKPEDRVLEVAVGTGATMLEILKRVDKTNIVSGVDLSHRMLQKTRRAVAKAGFSNVELYQADARSLPFEDGCFDVLFNSYMLDLIPLAEILVVLAEFRRVLKDNGRIVLVNMSRGREMTRWEKLYRATPHRLIPYLYGGGRPVFTEESARRAGFREVRRELIHHGFTSEIVIGKK